MNVLPLWSKSTHPIVIRYRGQPVLKRFQIMLVILSVVAFLLLGGLSLPVVYCLFWLVALLFVATSTAEKVYHERENLTWDLVRLTPYSTRELLLSLWAASLWQLNRTWLMWIYRVLHAFTIVGLLVYVILIAEVPTDQWLTLLFMATLLIVLQPLMEMYYCGMIGLVAANHLPDRGSAQGLTVGAVLIYWFIYVAGSVALLYSAGRGLTAGHLNGLFMLSLLVPLALGYLAQRIAEFRLI